MATANFRRMDHFPLYVIHYWDELSEEDRETEPSIDAHDVEDIQRRLDRFNKWSNIFEVDIIGGYYSGVQLYVYWKDDIFQDILDVDIDEEVRERLYDNTFWDDFETIDEARDFIDKEYGRATGILDDIASEYGFFELRQVGSSSSGEAFYTKVGK